MYYKGRILFRFVFHITRVKININVTYEKKKNDTRIIQEERMLCYSFKLVILNRN